MAQYKIIHIKKDCISCGACAAINPDFWEMDPEGLAHLKESTPLNNHWERDIPEESKASNQEAADVCPVNIIKVEKKE